MNKTTKEVIELQKPNPIIEPSEEAMDSYDDEDEFNILSRKVELEIEENYSPQMVKAFARLAYEITIVGLQIKEACIIVGVDYEKLVVLMKQDPLIDRLMKTKDIEYKRGLMKKVSEKAKTDDKTAQWLLQARYPDEFNPRKGSGGGGDDSNDMLGVAIEFIQKSGDNSPLVTEKSGKITMVKRTASENNDMMKRIGDMLK